MWTEIFCVFWVCLSYSPFVIAQVAPQSGSKLNIFVSNWEPGRILRLSKQGNNAWAARVNTYFRRPAAIDVDTKAEQIYYTDISYKRIYRVGTDATGRTTLFTFNETATPEGLAIDATKQKLFYSDSRHSIIASTNLDGKRHTILFSKSDGLSRPKAIIADKLNSKLFWTDWAGTPYIATGSYDGTGMTKIITEDLQWPTGLTLDTKNNILFWCDARTDKIESSSVDGSNRKELLHETKRSSYFTDIMFNDGTLYFTDRYLRAVLAMSSNGGPVRNVSSSSLITSPAGLYVASGKLSDDCNPGQYISFENICQPCGHCNSSETCNPLTGSCPTGCKAGYQGTTCTYECSFNTYGVNCRQDCGYCRTEDKCDSVTGHCPRGCKTGWKGIKCDEQDGEPDITIVVGNMSPGRLYTVSKSADHVWTTRLNVSLIRPAAVDFDPVQKEIYWTDIIRNRIAKIDMNGNYKILLQLSSFSTPDGLVLDIGAQKLFYTDTGLQVIGSMNMNGTSKNTLLRRSGGLDKPRALALDQRNRKIYWSDWGSNPHIATANYDGSNMTKIITTGLVWPFGLALDIRNKAIFWCDARTGKIGRSWVDGSHQRTLYYDPEARFYDIVFYRGLLYFTDWNTRAILILPATGGGLQRISSSLLSKASGLHVIPKGNTECEPGAYGKYCQYVCGNCAKGVCDSMTGRCTDGCLPGWRGEDCRTTCPPNTYGTCHDCGHCAGNGQCDKVSGYCPNGCQLGWKGNRCDIKCYISYGQSCVRCGHCLYDKPCDEATGHCLNGCAYGWTGPLCKTRHNVPVLSQPGTLTSTGDDNTAVIAGAVGGSLALLLIILAVVIVVAVILARRMKLRNSSRQSSEEGTRQSRVFGSQMALPPPYGTPSSVMTGVRYVTSADDAVLVTNQEDGQSVMTEGGDGAAPLPEKESLPE